MDNNKECKTSCQSISWWATLVVAVLAVPALGIIVVSILGLKGMEAIAALMITCWISTYLGMRLMHNPKIAEKIEPPKN